MYSNKPVFVNVDLLPAVDGLESGDASKVFYETSRGIQFSKRLGGLPIGQSRKTPYTNKVDNMHRSHSLLHRFTQRWFSTLWFSKLWLSKLWLSKLWSTKLMSSRTVNHVIVSSIVVLAVLSSSGCGDKDALATVNGKTISKQQFEAYVKFKRINSADPTRRTKAFNQYVDRAALTAAIENTNKLDNSLIEVELDEFRKEMLISRYFEMFLKQKINDNAVRNFYTANEKDYQQKQVQVAHILLRTNRNMGDAERKVKLTTAQEAYSKINSGKTFVDTAKKYSEDTNSAKKGGALGWIKQGAIDKRFSEKIFSMKVGDVSEPFETSFGYHIVKLMEGPQVITRPFDAVKGDIHYKLRNQAKKAELDRLKTLVSVKKMDK